MNIISVGSDRKLFEKGSAVEKRVVEYAEHIGPHHIVVFTKRKDGFKVRRIGENVWVYPTNSRSRLLYVVDAIRLAKKEFGSVFGFGVDVTTAQDPFESGLAAYFIARRFGKPLQLQVHTNLSHLRGFLNIIRRSIARYLFKRVKYVRVVSPQVKEVLEKKYPHLSITLLPIYVDTAYFKDTKPTFDLHERYPQFHFIILMAGRLTKEKNYLAALDILKDVLASYRMAGLVITGDGPMKKKILSHAKKLGIENHVVIEDWQPDLLSHYKTANLFLHTSLFEGYGMVLVEAAASGLPIVSSDVGVASLMKKSGYQGAAVCAVGDKECFVREIVSFINDNARRVFSKFSQYDVGSFVAVTKEEYLEAYKQALLECM